MKKILLSTLAALAVSSAAFAGDGTEASPYTVAEVVAMGPDANKKGVFVEGVIVGFINGMSYSDAVFGLPTEDKNQTNIILGGSSSEDDIKYCLPVQLPGNNVRTDLNLWKNPDVLGHRVILGGDIIKYFGQIGIKNTNTYKWVGEAPELGTGGGSGTGGSGSTDGGYLVSGMDDFTIDNVNLPSDLNFVWQWDPAYGAKASAFYNSTNYAAESILISPEIDVPADAQNATFSQALNYLNGNNRADYVNVVIREGNGEWQTANVSAWPAGTDWGFVDNCGIDISAYAGKKIQIGFRYTSSNTCAPTWEVKRLVIGGTPSNPGTPDTPGTGDLTGDNVTFDFTNVASLGFDIPADATEFDLTGKTMTNGVVTLLCEGEGAQTPIRLFSSNGNWTFRIYNGTSVTVSVAEGNVLTGIVFNGTNIGTNWTYSNGSLSGTTWTPQGEVNSVKISKVKTGDNPTIKSMTVYYSGDSGVADVLAAEDSEAVYFNLQGQRVANPERGIFVKVVGGKAVKVLK